jgi:hypothetical protein
MTWTQTNFPSFTPSLEGEPVEGLQTPTVDQKHRLGMRYQDGFGRVYRYCRAGAAACAPAQMQSAPVAAAEILNIAQTGYTTSIGDTRISVLITTGSGVTDGDFELYDPIRIATTATTDFEFFPNLYNKVIVNATTPTGLPVGVNATTPTGLPVGVPNVEIAINYYGWIQTKGPCSMLVDTGETLTIGCMCGHPATSAVAGAVGVCAVTEAFYGQVITISEADEHALINLMLE